MMMRADGTRRGEGYGRVQRVLRDEYIRRVVSRPDGTTYERTIYIYHLVCGHVVDRFHPRRKFCYCEQCLPSEKK